MNNFVSLWQRVYFNVFAFNRFTQLYVWGLPFLLLLRNKHVKKAYQKRGVSDPEKTVKHALVGRQDSTIVWVTDVFMCSLVMLIIFTIANLLSAVVGVVIMASMNEFVFIAAIIVSTMGINYLILWKNDRHKDYFKRFELESKEKKRKWAWISLGVVVVIILLVILSFIIMTEGLHRGDNI